MTVPVTEELSARAYVTVPAFELNVYWNAAPGIRAPELNTPVLLPVLLMVWVTLSLFTKEIPVPGRMTSV